eukprot:873216-Rhodomonas_salina.4
MPPTRAAQAPLAGWTSAPLSCAVLDDLNCSKPWTCDSPHLECQCDSECSLRSIASLSLSANDAAGAAGEY